MEPSFFFSLWGLLLWALPAAAMGACPGGYPSRCRCGPALLPFGADGKLFPFASAVVCSDASTLDSDDFVNRLPAGTEALVLRGGNLDSFPEGRLLLAAAAQHAGLEVKLLAIEDVQDGGDRLDLGTALCAFPRLQVVRMRNASLPSGRLRVVDPSCARSLTLLDLRDNPTVRYVPEATVRWLKRRPGVRVLLEGVPFSCDCNLAAFHEWLLHHDDPRNNNYTCADGFPETLVGRPLRSLAPGELRCSDDALGVRGAVGAAEGSSRPGAMRGLYLAAATLGVVACAVVLFALYVHFPVFELWGFGCRRQQQEPSLLDAHLKPNGLRRKQYSSLPSLHGETAA